MKIVQIIPELNAGGVERGLVEFAEWLLTNGHQAVVISNGGRLVHTLLAKGIEHIEFPVHKKSLLSIRHIRPLRQLLLNINADVIHVRSRLPAWLVWFAIGKLPRSQRPALVTTFHGLYSINRYSEIMGCGDQVIAISRCVHTYITQNYPRINPQKIHTIERGVNQQVFNRDILDERWQQQFFEEQPQLINTPLILMPGRLSAWKGQQDFIDMMAILHNQSIHCHGLIVGEASPSKQNYHRSLIKKVVDLNLENRITFLGHRSDMEQVLGVATAVCNFSNRPEPFGRTVIEAIALGVPVIAYHQGGPAESLQDCFPQGLVAVGDIQAAANKIITIINTPPTITLPGTFTLEEQARRTLAVYQQAIETN